MSESEKREREAFDAMLRSKIAAGEMTPDEAEHEWYYHFNGCETRESVYGI